VWRSWASTSRPPTCTPPACPAWMCSPATGALRAGGCAACRGVRCVQGCVCVCGERMLYGLPWFWPIARTWDQSGLLWNPTPSMPLHAHTRRVDFWTWAADAAPSLRQWLCSPKGRAHQALLLPRPPMPQPPTIATHPQVLGCGLRVRHHLRGSPPPGSSAHKAPLHLPCPRMPSHAPQVFGRGLRVRHHLCGSPPPGSSAHKAPLHLQCPRTPTRTPQVLGRGLRVRHHLCGSRLPGRPRRASGGHRHAAGVRGDVRAQRAGAAAHKPRVGCGCAQRHLRMRAVDLLHPYQLAGRSSFRLVVGIDTRQACVEMCERNVRELQRTNPEWVHARTCTGLGRTRVRAVLAVSLGRLWVKSGFVGWWWASPRGRRTWRCVRLE